MCVFSGAAGNNVVPNAGFITMFVGALMKLVSVVQAEYHTKPVRVNEVWKIEIELKWHESTQCLV